MPRHILDVRPACDMPGEGEGEISADEEDSGAGGEVENSEEVDSRRTHLARQRKPPPWLDEYDRE